MHIKPRKVLLRYCDVDSLSKGHRVGFPDPYPKARCQAAERKRASCESDELKSCDTNITKQCISGCLRSIGSDWKASECVECLTDDEGHERGNSSRNNRGENSRKEKNKEVTPRNKREEKANGGRNCG